jgi:hypothetical protein
MKKIIHEKRVTSDVLVVTTQYRDDLYETQVIGGCLDGWVLASETKEEALEASNGVATLAKQTETVAEASQPSVDATSSRERAVAPSF